VNFVNEPKVALIGKPVFEIDGVMRFLDEHGYSWPELEEKLQQMISLGDDDAEWLVETAGRMCYQSWPKRGETMKGRSHEDHIKHLIEVKHGACIEHANFTFAIWGISRSLSHELVRHRIASYCLAGDTVIHSGSRIHGRFKGMLKKWTIKQLFDWSLDKKRKGRLKRILIRCFDNEKIIPINIKSVQQSGLKQLVKVTLADGKWIRCSKDHRFLTNINGKNIWKSIKELSVGELLAINGKPIYKDMGWLRRKYHDENLSQKEMAKLAGVSHHTIRSWIRKYKLQKSFGSWSIGKTPWNKNKTYCAGWHHSLETRETLSQKKMGSGNPRWLGDAASQQAGRFRAQKLYDIKPCETCGSEEDICRHHIDENTHNNDANNIEFLCNSCHTTKHAAMMGKFTHTIDWQPIRSIVPDGKEMTYDIEVDHDCHNFVANGFITHNSQLSQRYVDSSSVAFIVPPAIQELAKIDQNAYQKWIDHCKQSRSLYEELTSKLSDMYVDIESKLERRKKARQAARSVLPNATETKIVVTMNARAIRHLIELRANPAADVEIRKLAVKICRILQDKAPLFAHGLGIVKLEDGTEGVESKYPRV